MPDLLAPNYSHYKAYRYKINLCFSKISFSWMKSLVHTDPKIGDRPCLLEWGTLVPVPYL